MEKSDSWAMKKSGEVEIWTMEKSGEEKSRAMKKSGEVDIWSMEKSGKENSRTMEKYGEEDSRVWRREFELWRSYWSRKQLSYGEVWKIRQLRYGVSLKKKKSLRYREVWRQFGRGKHSFRWGHARNLRADWTFCSCTCFSRSLPTSADSQERGGRVWD